ncbi:DELLA protein RGL1-like [Andrographis paniculata]|uniref:DELLA protein RGL1-like n=1 Tax=Andrographis paniculata TaxID=175694 RepID=UPI0021E78022|nr:DELLA protein RGL1-like [Andrographis paniculata]
MMSTDYQAEYMHMGNPEEWDLDLDLDLLGCDMEELFDYKVDHPGLAPISETPPHIIPQQQQQQHQHQYSFSWRYSPSPEAMETMKKRRPHLFSSGSASFDILNKYGNRCRRLNSEFSNISTKSGLSSGELSIEMIIQLAAENFIQTTSTCQGGDLCVLSHSPPYPGSILCHSKEDYEGIQLVQSLLCCADKVGKRQYESACKLLHECDRKSSPEGTPVQRLVFYFSEALHEKIDRETGRITSKGLGKKVQDPLEALHSPDSAQIAFHKEHPLSQITKFAGIQAVLDNIADATKVHFIDFEIRKGVQCIVLIQALATARRHHPIDHLKITAVGTRSKQSMEETGRQLMSFAQCVGLNFSFDVIMVDDISDLNGNLFQLDDDEAIAVYVAYALTHMISRPNQLEHLMGVIKSLNPCVMVVTEVEASCNSPMFVDRFVEALFFYGAYFESMANCLKNDEKHRSLAEGTCFSSSIRNMVAAEGEDRKIRHVGIDVWRAFFMQCSLEEIELSTSALYQAHLVLKNFTSGDCFTFDMDGRSLIIGWKRTPICSLSAWKFQCPQ